MINAYIIPGLKQGITPFTVLARILEKHNVDFNEICIKSRKREIIEYRQIVHTILKRHTSLSAHTIGTQVGMKDHCTVLWSIKAITECESLKKKHGIETGLLIKYNTIEREYLKAAGDNFKYYNSLKHKSAFKECNY